MAQKNNITKSEHTLLWPWFDFPWKQIELNYDTLDIIAHITQKATVLKGELLVWDLLKEPFVIRRNKPYNDNTGIWLYRNIFDVVGMNEVLKWYITANEI